MRSTSSRHRGKYTTKQNAHAAAAGKPREFHCVDTLWRFQPKTPPVISSAPLPPRTQASGFVLSGQRSETHPHGISDRPSMLQQPGRRRLPVVRMLREYYSHWTYGSLAVSLPNLILCSVNVCASGVPYVPAAWIRMMTTQPTSQRGARLVPLPLDCRGEPRRARQNEQAARARTHNRFAATATFDLEFVVYARR